MNNVQQLKYLPIFLDLDNDPNNWQPPNATVRVIYAYSPLAERGHQHFQKSTYGQLAKVWNEFLSWASMGRRDKKIVLIGHFVFRSKARIIRKQLETSNKWFDTLYLFKVLLKEQRLRGGAFNIYNLSSRFNVETRTVFNYAQLVSRVFDRVISPLPPIEVYKMISVAIDTPRPIMNVAAQIQIKKKNFMPQQIFHQKVYNKYPYKLRVMNDQFKLLAYNGDSWEICTYGYFTLEHDQSFKVQFANISDRFSRQDIASDSVTIVRTWNEFFLHSISHYEKEQWNTSQSNEERLKLIEQRVKFSEKDEIKFDDRFTCIISLTIMTHPQKLIGGLSLIKGAESHRFEFRYIMEWLERHPTNPINRLPLSINDLVPDETLAKEIKDFLEELKLKVFPWAAVS